MGLSDTDLSNTPLRKKTMPCLSRPSEHEVFWDAGSREPKVPSQPVVRGGQVTYEVLTQDCHMNGSTKCHFSGSQMHK